MPIAAGKKENAVKKKRKRKKRRSGAMGTRTAESVFFAAVSRAEALETAAGDLLRSREEKEKETGAVEPRVPNFRPLASPLPPLIRQPSAYAMDYQTRLDSPAPAPSQSEEIMRRQWRDGWVPSHGHPNLSVSLSTASLGKEVMARRDAATLVGQTSPSSHGFPGDTATSNLTNNSALPSNSSQYALPALRISQSDEVMRRRCATAPINPANSFAAYTHGPNFDANATPNTNANPYAYGAFHQYNQPAFARNYYPDREQPTYSRYYHPDQPY